MNSQKKLDEHNKKVEKLLSELPKDIKKPVHVAIIPDGNMRWARQNDLTYREAIDEGIESILKVFSTAKKLDIKYVTAWGFSTENWKRDPKVFKRVIAAILKMLKEQREEFLKEGIRFTHIGSLTELPEALVTEITALEKATIKCTKHFLTLGLNYGGRNEILRAVRKIVKKGYKVKEITEELIEQHLDTKGMPHPDLIIRTSGEQRLSGLMPWQSTYSEFYFTDTLWPDFDEEDFLLAVKEYSRRDRRFGAGQNVYTTKI